MKSEAKKPESDRECGCKSGSGSVARGESCCQSDNSRTETIQAQKHSHEHTSEHNCGHNCDCR